MILLGHNAPSYALTKLLIEIKNMYDMGIPIRTENQVLFFNQTYLSGPCSWKNANTCPSILSNTPIIRFLTTFYFFVLKFLGDLKSNQKIVHKINTICIFYQTTKMLIHNNLLFLFCIVDKHFYA